MGDASIARSDAADLEKRAAAEVAAGLVPDGARVGLGTGSTAAFLLPALARRRLHLRCVATSAATERAATTLGLNVEPFESLDALDIAIDGADQVDPDGWLIKGGGAAHTREKIVAAAAARFVVIASSDKVVERLQPPVPLELLAFGLRATLRALAAARVRGVHLSRESCSGADAVPSDILILWSPTSCGAFTEATRRLVPTAGLVGCAADRPAQAAPSRPSPTPHRRRHPGAGLGEGAGAGR
jgi:ribose 5-phosphate isomerase A